MVECDRSAEGYVNKKQMLARAQGRDTQLHPYMPTAHLLKLAGHLVGIPSGELHPPAPALKGQHLSAALSFAPSRRYARRRHHPVPDECCGGVFRLGGLACKGRPVPGHSRFMPETAVHEEVIGELKRAHEEVVC